MSWWAEAEATRTGSTTSRASATSTRREAVAGALPVGRNSPQRVAYGLYAEQLSGHRVHRRPSRQPPSWLYRIRPTAAHPEYVRGGDGDWRSAPFTDVEPDPNRLRWDPIALPEAPTDFVDGLWTVGGNGHVERQFGIGVHLYRANRSMTQRVLVDADGELLVVPQLGRLLLHTELGVLEVRPRQRRCCSAGSALPGRAARCRGARVRLRELRPAVHAARAGPDRVERTGQRP